MVRQGPKGNFAPLTVILPAGSRIYRVSSNKPGRVANVSNPGAGNQQPTRFAFFGDPIVPVLYAAAGERSAVSETLLHDVPIAGGALRSGDYEDKVMSRLVLRRDLCLASFMGHGLRALGVEARDLTMSEADRYSNTVKWAEAAHKDGFDGCVWMSRQFNEEQAYVFFGDRVPSADLTIDPGFARAFALPDDIDWLSRMCTPLNVSIRR